MRETCAKGKHVFVAVIAVVAVALALIAIPSMWAAALGRPFHANLRVLADPRPTDNPCAMTNHEVGSGIALHLGAMKWESSETATFSDCPNVVFNGPNKISVTGNFTLTAANGDKIEGTYTTIGTLDFTEGVSVSGTYHLLSGSGRFMGVTGTGLITATGDLTPGSLAIGTMDGIINY